MASARSLYDILNVSHDAEGVVIEAAYRALMKKYHPDQAAGGEANGGSSAAEINQAFAVLRDPKRRAGYDRHEWNERGRGQPVRLEPAPQPPPARRSGFAWTGWLVAILLGAILYAVLNGRGGLIVPPPPGNQSAAAEFDHRTQPVKIAPAMDEATTPTAIDREIVLSEAQDSAARRGQGVLDEAIEAARDAVPDADTPAIVPEPEPFQLHERAAPSRPRARVVRRNGRAVPRSREDEDFLKREGYIY